MKKLIFALLFIPSASFGATVCTQFDITDMTREQINSIKSVSYKIAFDNGDNIVPTVQLSTVAVICFLDPTINVRNVITKAAVLAEYAAQETARAQAKAVTDARIIELRGYLTDIDNSVAVWETLSLSEQQAILKKLIQIVVADKLGVK